MSSFKDKLAMFNTSNTKKNEPKKAEKALNKPGKIINEKNYNGQNIIGKSEKNQSAQNNTKKEPEKKQNPIQNKVITSKEKTNINGSNKILQNTKKEKERTNKNIIQPKDQTEKSKENDEANTNIKIVSKIGKLIDGKHPVYGSKKIGEIKGRKNTLQLYDYPLNIEYSSNEESISIIFVGQSGTGKSTFINAYVNHLLGITQYDDIRYKLILGDQSKEKYQTINQTDFITFIMLGVQDIKINYLN